MRKFDGGTRKISGVTIMEVSAGAPAKVVWNIFDHLKPDLITTHRKDPDGVDVGVGATGAISTPSGPVVEGAAPGLDRELEDLSGDLLGAGGGDG